jgi:hypothetical protein
LEAIAALYLDIRNVSAINGNTRDITVFLTDLYADEMSVAIFVAAVPMAWPT